MSSARAFQPRYSVDDYSKWKGDWELWDGIAVSMSPSPFGVHQKVVADLMFAMTLALRSCECDAVVLGELDWIVTPSTVVRPDVIVVCGEFPKEHLHQSPGLIAEVLSPSTRQNDLTFKRDLYHRERVETYLILDPELRRITKNEWGPSGYVEQNVSERLTVRVCDQCTITISVADIFR